ncbi:MAG: nucleotidyl transferase AbiEii/AbiGii toxin family protein [Candidatus Micrarchaeota archaeon]
MEPFDLRKYLKHPPNAFSKEQLTMRAKKYGFTQPQFLELLAWDYELVAQLQAANDKLILKGGAAVQLYLPPEVQRSSVDIDFIAPGIDETGIELIMGQVRSQLAMLTHFRAERLAPKSPELKLPMLTYIITLPSSIGQMGKDTCRIKIDFLLANYAPPITNIPDVETVAIRASGVKAESLGSLIGDKLCTLAIGTIGIRRLQDYPKHLYDLELLAYLLDYGSKAFEDSLESMHQIIPFESKIRGTRYSLEEVLASVEKTATGYSAIDLSNPAQKMADARENLDNFQQIYLPKPQKKPYYEWSIKALKVRYLAKLAKLTDDAGPEEALKALKEAKQLEQRLANLRGKELEDAKQKLLMKINKNEFDASSLKEMRQKPIRRIYWQVLEDANSPKELKEII